MKERERGSIDPGETGGRGTDARSCEVSQTFEAKAEPREPTTQLMELICTRDNLNHAYKRVKANKGAAGIDGMTVEQLLPYLKTHGEELIGQLLTGQYQPKPVREVEIPKPTGGVRLLGIPTVIDRWIQQSILQILEPIFDPTFSESSYGFRPKRSAHGALKRASEYVATGRVIVVDIDLEKFFDRVNHDILMSRMARRIDDKRLLKVIRGFLNAGIMRQGVCVERSEGTPQGGPLSPLLSNVLLDELDKELEKRGHCFCRYADDCNIYVRSQVSGERVLRTVREFLEKRLKLKVNEAKSAVGKVNTRKFLGYRILSTGDLTPAPESLKRAKDKIRRITRRNRGHKLETIIEELNPFLRGWIDYFYLAKAKKIVELDAWTRRRLRCYRLKQRKRSRSIAAWLQELGVQRREANNLAYSSKGWWKLSQTPALHAALSNKWFEAQGLVSLVVRKCR